MKNSLLILTFLMVAIASCQETSEKKAEQPTEAPKKDTVVVKTVLATNRDMACGMSVSDDVVDTVHYKGKIYGFCSPDCKKGFQSDPETYLAQ